MDIIKREENRLDTPRRKKKRERKQKEYFWNLSFSKNYKGLSFLSQRFFTIYIRGRKY